jgi:hypothetical protein
MLHKREKNERRGEEKRQQRKDKKIKIKIESRE